MFRKPSLNFYFCQHNCRKSDFARSTSSKTVFLKISQDRRKLYLIIIIILRDVSEVALSMTDPGTLPHLK